MAKTGGGAGSRERLELLLEGGRRGLSGDLGEEGKGNKKESGGWQQAAREASGAKCTHHCG